jgi:hypothetical protein
VSYTHRRGAIMLNTSVTVYWQDTIIFHKKTDSFELGKDIILPIEGSWKLLENNMVKIPINATVTCEGQELYEKIIDITAFKKIDVHLGNFKILIRRYEIDAIDSRFDLSETISNKVYIGLSAVCHVLLMSAFAFFMPPLGINDAEAMEKDQLFLMQQYLNASAEREQEAREESTTVEDNTNSNEGGTGTRAIGEEGSMGNPNSRATNKSYTIAGPSNNKDIHIAREAALRDASTFGMIGLLNTGSTGDPNVPTAPWGRDDTLGSDLLSARGNMWGESPGEAYGAGGLGLSGIGEYGGGKGEGIGLGSIGTIGHGAGLGDKQGFGNGHGYLNGAHKPKTPQVRIGTTIVNGRLPPEVIQRIVRQNYGRFRACYENGLRSNPSLQGRVSVRFIIGRDGSVSNVGNGGSDLPDPSVVSCVVRSYYGLSFPAPEGGIVTVTYPIMFNPQ